MTCFRRFRNHKIARSGHRSKGRESDATSCVTAGHTLSRMAPCWVGALVAQSLLSTADCAAEEANISPGGTVSTTAPSQTETPIPQPKQLAITVNPLNLIIGRYAFNFEYEPLLHHSLIITPHYDYSSNAGGDCGGCTDTLTGAGGEFGYRFYAGKQGFDGFFAGPSLLVARYTVTSTYAGDSSDTFGSIGGALDAGWQWLLGNFVVGTGLGVQYTKVDYKLGYNAWLDYHGGGGLRPRFVVSLGGAL